MRFLPIDTGIDTATETGRGSVAGPRLGFGCASLGDVLNFSAKCRIVEAAYEAGFRHFDAAPSYGHGEAEAVLATVLSGVRRQVSIVSKTGIAHPKGGGAMLQLRRFAAPAKRLIPGLWGVASRKTSRLIAPAGRFSPEQIEASVGETMRRLRFDALDALLLHEVSLGDLSPEVLATLDGLRSRGVALALGTGTGVDETARIAAAHPGRFQAFQVNHYWGSRTPSLKSDVTDLITHRCIRTGLELLGDPAFQEELASHERARELKAACADRSVAVDLFLAAALRQRGPSMVLVSTSKPARARHFAKVAADESMALLAAALNDCLDRVAIKLRPGAGADTGPGQAKTNTSGTAPAVSQDRLDSARRAS